MARASRRGAAASPPTTIWIETSSPPLGTDFTVYEEATAKYWPTSDLAADRVGELRSLFPRWEGTVHCWAKNEAVTSAVQGRGLLCSCYGGKQASLTVRTSGDGSG